MLAVHAVFALAEVATFEPSIETLAVFFAAESSLAVTPVLESEEFIFLLFLRDITDELDFRAESVRVALEDPTYGTIPLLLVFFAVPAVLTVAELVTHSVFLEAFAVKLQALRFFAVAEQLIGFLILFEYVILVVFVVVVLDTVGVFEHCAVSN